MTIELNCRNNDNTDMLIIQKPEYLLLETKSKNQDEYRISIYQAMEREVMVSFQQEIRNAAQELIRTQRLVLGISVAESRQIFKEVLDEEKWTIKVP
jgi:hypothetical protein